MIDGAVQIFGGVPGTRVDPFLLAKSQEKEMSGFIMIAYGSAGRAIYDLLFLKGPHIVECGRMSPDLRVRSTVREARERFNLAKAGNQIRVFLFEADPSSLQPFLKTFTTEPCLKVPIENLSAKQISFLLKSTGCCHGILERNDFNAIPPRIEFRMIESASDTLVFPFSLKRGRLVVYDIDKSKDLVPEVPPAQMKRDAPGAVQQPLPQLSGETQPGPEVEEFIRPVNPPGSQSSNGQGPGLLKSESISQPRLPIELVQPGANAKAVAKSTASQAKNEAPTPHTRTPQTEPCGRFADPVASPTPGSGVPDAGEYTRLFDRLFRSFRQRVIEVSGPRSGDLIARGEQQAKFLSPDFDLQNLSVETAPGVLHLMETVIKEAPMLKRPRLREAILILIAELYDKHYDALEHFKSLDAVEQFYYRLKR